MRLRGGGGGGGGGGHTDYFVKLDFVIAVDQQTRARDRNFEVVPDPGCPPVPAGQPRPYLVNLRPRNWLSYEQNTMAHPKSPHK